MPRWRHLRAIALLPFTVTVVVPLLLIATNPINPLWGLPFPINLLLVITAVMLIALGLWLFYATNRLFATIGQGTLAPWDETQRLVVRGIYRHVRNPMISGVFAVLLGEMLLFGSPALLIWCAIFAAVNLIYMPLVEEPGLEARFGEDYRLYKRHVPRWLPRRRGWEAPTTNA